MFLTSIYVLRPVTRVRPLIIEQPTNTKLFCGRAIPAGPVPGAGGLVSEDTVQPVAVLCADGRVGLGLVIAVVAPPRVVATVRHPPVFAREHQPVGAVVQLRLPPDTLPVPVAVGHVANHARLCLTWVFLVVPRPVLLLLLLLSMAGT